MQNTSQRFLHWHIHECVSQCAREGTSEALDIEAGHEYKQRLLVRERPDRVVLLICATDLVVVASSLPCCRLSSSLLAMLKDSGVTLGRKSKSISAGGYDGDPDIRKCLKKEGERFRIKTDGAERGAGSHEMGWTGSESESIAMKSRLNMKRA